VKAAIVGGALVVALFTCYQVGHRFGFASGKQRPEAKQQDEIDRLLSGPARPEVLTAAPPPPRPRAREAGSARSSGSATGAGARTATPSNNSATEKSAAAATAKPSTPRHVLLETFKPADRASAEFAQKWLATNRGMQTTIETRSSGIALVSNDVFDYSRPGDEQRAKDYLDKVKSLGKTLSKEMTKAGIRNYLFTSPAIR
jgi:hypothetical protein